MQGLFSKKYVSVSIYLGSALLKYELEPTGVMAFWLRAKFEMANAQARACGKARRPWYEMDKKWQKDQKYLNMSDKNQNFMELADKTRENYDKLTGMNWVKAVNKPIERAS